MTEEADRPVHSPPRPKAEQAPTPIGADQEQIQFRIDAAMLRIARLIGRQMAREEFERSNAANDNRLPHSPDTPPRR